VVISDGKGIVALDFSDLHDEAVHCARFG